MFGWTKGLKPKEDEPKRAPAYTAKEQELLSRVSNDFQVSRAVRMSDIDKTGYSVEDNWEDEAYIYKGGGLQWVTNIAYRSQKARQYRPNSEDNLVFNAINTLHANITASIPDFTIDGTGDTNIGEDIAEKITDAVRFNDKRNNFPHMWKKLVYDLIGAGPTIAMVTWDNEWMGGKGPDRWVGDVRVERVDKWDIYFDPAVLDLEENLQDCSYIVRRPRKKLDFIKKTWKNGKYVSATTNEDDEIDEGGDPEQAYIEEYWHRGFPLYMPEEKAKKIRERAAELEREGDTYKAQDYYDAANGDLEGIHVAYVSDGVLLEYCPYEYEDGLYPFVYTEKYSDDKCQLGFGEIRNIKIPQIMHNKSDEIELEAMSTEGLGGHFYQKGAINNKQLTRIIEHNGKGGMMLEVDNLQGILPRTGPKVPSSIAAYKDHKQRMIDTVSQVSPTMQGLQQGSNTPARAIQELGARSDIRVKQAAEKLEDFLIKIKQLQISKMAQFYTEDRYYRVRTSDNKIRDGKINAMELHREWVREYEQVEEIDPTTGAPTMVVVEKKERFVPEFDIKVTILSEKPTDRNYYTTLAFDLYNMQLLTAEDLYATLEEGKLPPVNDIMENLKGQNEVMAMISQIQALPEQAQQMALQQMKEGLGALTQNIQQIEQLKGRKEPETNM